jgi:ABC-2 type transport system ATP-binding protein
VVDAGLVVADGTPEELKNALGGDRLDVVVEHAGDLAAARQILAGVADGEPRVDADAQRVSAPMRHRVAALTRAAAALDGAGLAVRDIALRRPTLDEVFLGLTGRKEEG